MKFSSILASVIIACGLCSEARAAIIDITYTGTVGLGYSTGMFGSSVLTGDPYTLTYQFDTSAGLLSTGTNYVQLAGGPGFGPALVNPYSSPGTAALTINGQTVTVAIPSTSQNPNSFSEAFASLQGTQIFVEQKIQNEVNTATDLIHSSVDTLFYTSLLAPLQLTAPFTFTLNPANQAYSAFSFYDFNYGTSGDLYQAYGELDPTRVSVSVSATPLPASWSMMLAGLGVLGFVATSRAFKSRRSIRRTDVGSAGVSFLSSR